MYQCLRKALAVFAGRVLVRVLGRVLSLALAAALGAVLAIALLSTLGLVAPVSGQQPSSEEAAVRVYRDALPGVVSIVDRSRPGTISPETIVGSGFVVDLEGHVLTNHHVVDGMLDPGVVLADESIYPAELIGGDRRQDLAVLETQIPSEKLHPLRLGDSSALQVGQQVFAIGSPFGLERSLTSGVVSFVGRRIEIPGEFAIEGAIQTDVAINVGNSGGPLLTTSGEVIGVNTVAIITRIGRLDYGALGVGFAIPSSLSAQLLPEMIAGSLQARPWLGVMAQDLPPQPTDQGVTGPTAPSAPEGAMVFVVLPGTAAEQAGLRGAGFGDENSGWKAPLPGDVITAIDGVRVKSVGDLASYLAGSGKHVGDVVSLQLVREGELLEVSLRLGARDDKQADLVGAL
jgi:S1-C subfamily serine protease